MVSLVLLFCFLRVRLHCTWSLESLSIHFHLFTMMLVCRIELESLCWMYLILVPSWLKLFHVILVFLVPPSWTVQSRSGQLGVRAALLVGLVSESERAILLMQTQMVVNLARNSSRLNHAQTTQLVLLISNARCHPGPLGFLAALHGMIHSSILSKSHWHVTY